MTDSDHILRDLLRSLREYQSRRIHNTYRDFEEKEEYLPLVRFFMEEIYGPHDFSFRNHSIKNLHQKLNGILKGDIIESVGKVIELHDLTEELDQQMARVMRESGVLPPVEQVDYEAAYRACDNYARRVRQIDLLLSATRNIHRISRFAFIGVTLKVVKGAATVAGFGEIMKFLYKGYQAFHRIKDITPFLKAVQEREQQENDRLFRKSIENSD